VCWNSSKKIGIVPAAGCARSSGTSTVPHVAVTPGLQSAGVTTGGAAKAPASASSHRTVVTRAATAAFADIDPS
jgi:hypothetical protein